MSLSASIKASISAQHSKALDLGTANLPANLLASLALTDGTGANQADKIFTDTRTLAASANEDLDLAGSLADAYGTTFTLARLKALMIVADASNTNNVRLIRPASNGVPLFLAASDGIDIRPGGVFLWACSDATAVAITAGTGDLINIANSSGTTSVTYSIILIGAST